MTAPAVDPRARARYNEGVEGSQDGSRADGAPSPNNVIDFPTRAALAPVLAPSTSVSDGQRGAALCVPSAASGIERGTGVDKGYTPTPDCIRDDIDVMAAVVFGAVYRFCQMPGGLCTAGLETIAERAGMKTTATRIRLQQLVARGWLTAHVVKGRPTSYRDAGKWATAQDDTPPANVGVGAQPLRQTEATPTANAGVPLRLTDPKKSSLRKNSKTQDIPAPASSTPTPAASPKVRKPRPPATPRPRDAFFDAFCAAFGIDADKPGRRAGLAGEFSKRCKAAGATIGQFREYYRTSKAAGEWGKFDQPHNVADRFLATIAPTSALDAPSTTDARPPINRVARERGFTVSDVASWPADVLAAYPDIAIQWGHVITEAAR